MLTLNDDLTPLQQVIEVSNKRLLQIPVLYLGERPIHRFVGGSIQTARGRAKVKSIVRLGRLFLITMKMKGRPGRVERGSVR